MRVALGTLLLTLLLSTQGWTQINIGPMAGINFGGPIGKVDSAEGNPITAFEVGLFAEFQFAERWSFKPHMYYTQKGAGYSQSYRRDTIVEIEIQGIKGEIPTFYRASVNGDVLAHYIELPLLVSYKNKKGFFIDAGPYLSFLVASKDKGHLRLDIGEDGFITDESDFEYTNAINPFEYGAVFSGGYEFNFGLSLYVKGTRSFTKLYKTSHFESLQQTEVKLYNTIVAFGLKYALVKPTKQEG